ncbi:hypothetical protein EVAR_4391_1 [Eumeta japonica]|uniref:Uncharacterized protein n=1 Tax=Eumeta variegata TaxID=151549 RepID=A0A4C1SXM4_EUMVA|nr:hypothetical protein EVAR_4391_1 [Eumeta japonica]
MRGRRKPFTLYIYNSALQAYANNRNGQDNVCRSGRRNKKMQASSLLTYSSDFGAVRLDPCELRTVVPYSYTLSERLAELHDVEREKSDTSSSPAIKSTASDDMMILCVSPEISFGRQISKERPEEQYYSRAMSDYCCKQSRRSIHGLADETFALNTRDYRFESEHSADKSRFERVSFLKFFNEDFEEFSTSFEALTAINKWINSRKKTALNSHDGGSADANYGMLRQHNLSISPGRRHRQRYEKRRRQRAATLRVAAPLLYGITYG